MTQSVIPERFNARAECAEHFSGRTCRRFCASTNRDNFDVVYDYVTFFSENVSGIQMMDSRFRGNDKFMEEISNE